ncbi:MAG: phage integrase N-terminal SAM-like domain-containing protein [Deltaproteobacteria bacterium]|nr:phage integrase N-terminal SAM-like domain-containing protein [Deltaproteobacteria bacterium]
MFQKARYIQFSGGKTHPRKLDAQHIEKFLSHLATKGNFAASTQHQALNPDYAVAEFAEDARRRMRRRTLVLQAPDNKANSVKSATP